MITLAVLALFLLTAAGFVYFLVHSDRGEHEPRGALWMAFGMGLVAVVLAINLELRFAHEMTEGTVSGMPQLALAALKVGLIEELAKCLPLALIIYHKRYFNEHTDGVVYFALAGLGFGLVENLLYTAGFGAGVGIARLILTPLFHAATTAMIGYALVKVKLDKASKWSAVGMVVAVILIHALYDFGVLSGIAIFIIASIVLTFGLGVNLFVMLRRARYQDQQKGLSAVGNNSFCRNCGHPNPKHHLYCTQCGKQA